MPLFPLQSSEEADLRAQMADMQAQREALEVQMQAMQLNEQVGNLSSSALAPNLIIYFNFG